MATELRFRKSGKDIKAAIGNRVSQLQLRLDKRNAVLKEFMQDSSRTRSYLVRSSRQTWAGHGSPQSVLFSKDDISSEEMEEIGQLCRRIFEIEQELRRLTLVAAHLADDQVFELPFQDLVSYGFEVTMENE